MTARVVLTMRFDFKRIELQQHRRIHVHEDALVGTVDYVPLARIIDLELPTRDQETSEVDIEFIHPHRLMRQRVSKGSSQLEQKPN